MLKANKTYVALLLIFAFSFCYRILLMLWDGFPPGADIGLHNNVIYSITGSGNVDFFYNLYHMGGGTSLTFPGYHIFTSVIILMTGLPEYIAHAAVVSLFSALVVLVAYLITRRVWSEPAAYIVAILAAISRFDIEMLMWAGYPNVITLMLIPATFYLYLQKDRFSKAPFLVSACILTGSIFITHSLSAAIFAGVTVLTVLCILVKPSLFGTTRKTGLYWLLPLILGITLFSPFIIQAVPTYLNNNTSLDPTSSNAIKLATLATRTLPLELVLPLFGVVAGFLVFSKKYHGRFLPLPTFLLSMWLFVPLVLTLSYLVGFAIDFNRFLYFLILPLIIFIAVLIEHGSSFIAQVISNYKRSKKTRKIYSLRLNRFLSSLTQKKIYAGCITFFLLFAFVALPIFMGPMYNAGQSIQQYYQTMNNQGWDAIQWVQNNTPADAVFVSDALYGWWLGGFAQRRTYSAVDPQYLSINEEYNKTLFAKSLLDTDYLVDNGLIQVREDGGYIARHNPEIVAKLNWTFSPYTFFNFASNETTIRYTLNENLQQPVRLDELTVKDMRMEQDNQQVTITVTRGNDYVNYTQLTTVYKGQPFVNLTTTIDSTVPGVSLDSLKIDVQCRVNQTWYDAGRTVGLFDEPMKVFGQLIFNLNQPASSIVDNGTQHRIHLEYNLEGKQNNDIEISASAYSVSDNLKTYENINNKNKVFSDQMAQNLDSYQSIDDSKDWEQIFNYQPEIQRYNVSYIVCRVPEMFPKFLKDFSFSLVFFNNGTNTEVINEIAIFKVNGNLK